MTTEQVERKSIPTEEVSRVSVVVLDRETSATLEVVDRDQLHTSRVGRDGKVPWNTSILPILRGNRVTVDRLYRSVKKTYGEESISRMRCYKYLNQLVQQNIATKEFDLQQGEDVYIVSK